MHTICTIFAITFNINVFLWPVSRSRSMVMFGEYVDSMNVAIDIVSKADVFVVIGTSLKVYPAAGFINYAHHEVPKFVIDPGEMDQCTHLGFTHFKTTATEGMKMLLEAFKEL